MIEFGRPRLCPDHQPGICHIGAAIVGGLGSVGAAFIGSKAASKAADAQTTAANNSIAALKEFFGISKEQLQPFIDSGKNVLGLLDPNNASSPLASLIKLTTPGADMTSVLEQTPGFQFTSQYGQKAVQNALAARGLGGPGGPLARGIADYTTGLASNTWSSVVDKLLSTLGGVQNTASLGSNAAANLATAAGNTGSGVGSNLIGIGNAQAGAATAQGNLWGNAIGSIGNTIGNQMTLQTLLSKFGQGNNSGGSIYGTGTWPSAGVPPYQPSPYG